MESCRLAGLPDLNQTHWFVHSTLKNWVHSTVKTYGFDAIRVDTVPEVPKDFWAEYHQSAGVYSIGEVFNENHHYVAGYQGALSALFNYPMFYRLNNVFMRKQSMYKIREGLKNNDGAFRDTSILGNFLDNHDNPRFLSGNRDWTVMKNGLAYVIFAEVYKVILQFHRLGWFYFVSDCREFHLFTMVLNKDMEEAKILQTVRVFGPTTTLTMTYTSL